MVGLAFAVAASANFPALLLALTWRRFNTAGAVTGVLFGVVSAIFLVLVSPKVWPGADTETGSPIGWTLANPGIVSIPLGFIGCYLGTVLTKEHGAERSYQELFVRSETGLGAERALVGQSKRHNVRCRPSRPAPAPESRPRRRDPWQTERRSNPRSASCSTRRPSSRRRSSPPRAVVADESMYEQAEADPEAFWAEQAEQLHWHEKWDAGARLVGPAERQVVPRRQAQRRLQLRRPPRRGRQRRPRRVPLARRGGRGARRHLRRPPPRTSRPSPTRSRTTASARATSSGSSCR